jgi:hypothetical protein
MEHVTARTLAERKLQEPWGVVASGFTTTTLTPQAFGDNARAARRCHEASVDDGMAGVPADRLTVSEGEC